MISPELLMNRLRAEVRHEVQRNLSVIAEEACEKLRAAILAEADRIALRILAEYSVTQRGSEIIITVRKEMGEKA